MRSVESCIDLLPSTEQRAQNVQESQYETAEMCPVEHLCKISSSQTGAKISSSYQHSNAVFSERSFSEDIREAQQHIQILSGRCSGSNVRYSQNSVAVSTPKTSEHQERNVLEDFAGHNSSGSSAYFETAKETQQNSTHLIFRKAKLSQSVKPHIVNEKKCSTSKSTKEAREANLNREDRGGLNLECEPATSRRGEGNVVESRNDEDDEAVSKLQQRNKKCSIGCTKKSGQSKNYQEGAVCGMEDDPVVVSIEENVTSKETNSRRSSSKYKKSPELVVSDLQDEPATTKMNECKVFDELLLEDVLEHVKNCLQDNEDAPNATKVPREKDSDLQYEAVTCEEGERKILEGIPAECARNSSQMNEVNDLMSQEKGEVGKKCAKSQEEGSKEKTQTGLEGNGEGDFDKKSDEVIVLFDSEVVMPNDASPVEERVPAVKDVKVSEEVQQIPVVSERKQELPNELEANENCHANSEESVIHFKKKMYRRQLSSTTNEDDKEEEREDKSLKELTNIQHVSRKALKKTGKRAKASKNKKRNKRKLENKDKLSNKKIFSAENAENLIKSVNFPPKTLNITADTFEKVDKRRTECKGKEDRNGFEIADVEVLNAPQSLTVVEELAKNCVVLLPKHPELEGIDENSSGESKESENPGNATQPTPTPNEDDMIEAGTAISQASDADSMIKKRKYTRQLSASTVENDVQGMDDYRFVEPIHNCEKSFDLLKKQEGEEKSARGDVINNSNLMQEDRLTQRTEIHTCDVYKNDRSANERACDGGINNPDLIVEDRLTQQTEIHVCDVHGKSDTDDLIVQDKSANNDVDKSNKQQGEERGIVGIKGNVPLTGDVGNRTVFNQTLSTTLGSRKMRKLYNPDDLSYLENVAVMELNKSEDRTERKKEVVSSRMDRKETSIAPTRRKVYRRKQAKEIKPKKKIVKPKKLKIVNLHTELTTPCNQNIVNLQSTFHKILESFQKEAKTSFSIIMQSNVQKNLIVPEEKNVSKTRKKGKKKCITKDIKRLNSRTKNATTVDRRMRAQVSSDQSEASVNLEKKRDSTDDKTVYNLSDEALFPPAPSTSKINIISDIQVRPKRAMPEDDCGVPAKKMKSVENCSSALEDVISGSISNKEICQWIETGKRQNFLVIFKSILSLLIFFSCRKP